VIHQSGSDYFLLQNLGFFPDSEESLKLFSNYPSMMSDTRSPSQTQRVRERKSFGSGAGALGSPSRPQQVRKQGRFQCRLGEGRGGGVVVCVDLSQFPGPEN
jgi:hypothetical protein